VRGVSRENIVYGFALMHRHTAEMVVCGSAMAIGVVIGCIVVCMLMLWYDALGCSQLPTAVTVDTTELLRNVTPGSLLLSRHVSESTRHTTLFNLVTASGDWYHCGMIVRRPSDSAVFVLDCMADGTTCQLPCAGSRPLGSGGPRLIPLMHFMLLYSLNPGISVVRRLQSPTAYTAEFRQRAWDVALQATKYGFLAGYEFPPKLFEGALERLSGLRIGRRDKWAHLASGVFCSEIVALMLMELGVLDDSMGAAALAPWSYCRSVFKEMLLPGHHYGRLERPDVFKRTSSGKQR
jgi:hypothetical protein